MSCLCAVLNLIQVEKDLQINILILHSSSTFLEFRFVFAH